MQRIIHNITVLGLVFTLLSCGNKQEKNAQDQTQAEETVDDRIFVSKEQFQHGKMIVGSLKEKPFPITVQTNGMIDVPPENRAVVNSIMGGYIKTTPLLVGDRVKKGQALVTIENPDFITLQQDYMEVKEQLTYLKSEFERQKTMVVENITSQKSFLQSESTYKQAIARYNGLRKQLEMLNISPLRVEGGNISSLVSIYAPISGSITKVNVTRGTYVSPATAILEIINNDHIHLELSVFEKDIMKLKKGQIIKFKIPEASKEIYKAEVHLIGTNIQENRTVKVHGHLENESEANFLTGMFVEADIVTESTSSLALPETALVEVDNVMYGLIMDEETENGYYFKQEKIDVASKYNGFLSISNLQENINSEFLLKGTFNLIVNE